MAKDPAFLFYYQDFLVGTAFMTDEEVGIYIKMICHQADKGRLSREDILNICKTYDKHMNLKKKFLVDDDGLYYNPRLEEEVHKRKNYCKSRAKNRKSTTYVKHMKNISKTYEKHMENEDEDINSINNTLEIEKIFLSTFSRNPNNSEIEETEKLFNDYDKAKIKEAFKVVSIHSQYKTVGQVINYLEKTGMFKNFNKPNYSKIVEIQPVRANG